MAASSRLVEEGELEERADVSAVGGEGDEDGDVVGVVIGALSVGVEVDGPVVPSDCEDVAGDEAAGTHALVEGEALDGERVRAPHRLGDGAGPGWRRGRRPRRNRHCIRRRDWETLPDPAAGP